MPLYTTEAIVLRTYQLGETDRIVVFLTRDRGQEARGRPRGARRSRRRFGGALEPLTRVRVAYFEKENRELVSLDYAEPLQLADVARPTPKRRATRPTSPSCSTSGRRRITRTSGCSGWAAAVGRRLGRGGARRAAGPLLRVLAAAARGRVSRPGRVRALRPRAGERRGLRSRPRRMRCCAWRARPGARRTCRRRRCAFLQGSAGRCRRSAGRRGAAAVGRARAGARASRAAGAPPGSRAASAARDARDDGDALGRGGADVPPDDARRVPRRHRPPVTGLRTVNQPPATSRDTSGPHLQAVGILELARAASSSSRSTSRSARGR